MCEQLESFILKMIGFRMSWILTVIILSTTFNINISEGRHKNKLPSAVVGTVYCDTCFLEDFSQISHFISGALVAVECGDKSSEPSFRKKVKTNEHGKFEVHLPFSVTKQVKKIEGCSAKLITSSEPNCAVASRSNSSSFHLKSRVPGKLIFSAGIFTFKPHKQPNLCNQTPSIKNSKKLNSPNSLIPTFPPVDEKYLPPLPTLPNLPPLPQLPPLPPLPGLPFFPPAPKKTIPSIFPPVLPPPPSIIPPVLPLPSFPVQPPPGFP